MTQIKETRFRYLFSVGSKSLNLLVTGMMSLKLKSWKKKYIYIYKISLYGTGQNLLKKKKNNVNITISLGQVHVCFHWDKHELLHWVPVSTITTLSPWNRVVSRGTQYTGEEINTWQQLHLQHYVSWIHLEEWFPKQWLANQCAPI